MREALLLAAGVGSISLGLFHFVLPRVYGWGPYLEQLPGSISWGVLSINAFLSTLFVLMGGITIAGVFDRGSGAVTIAFLAAMTIFWAVNCVYQIAIPFPIPASMVAIR